MRKISRRAWMAGVALASQSKAQELVRLPRKVRIAIIGLEGHTGEILDPMDRPPDLELAAVSDSNPSFLEGFARSRHVQGARPYHDWRELLDRERLDMAAICG